MHWSESLLLPLLLWVSHGEAQLPKGFEANLSSSFSNWTSPGSPVATDDKEIQEHREFSKPKGEFADLREAALKLLHVVEQLNLTSSNSSANADNSEAVKSNCPWRSNDEYRTNCQGENERKWRTMDGSCNNQENPLWGRAATPMERLFPNAYKQPGNLPRVTVRGDDLPSARLASTHAFTPGEDINRRKISTLFMQMGQFIDHDLTHGPVTPPSKECCDLDTHKPKPRGWIYPETPKHKECYPIRIPSNDTFWGNKNRTCMSFSRTDPSPPIPSCSSAGSSGVMCGGEPCGKGGVRQPMNALTHWLDASNIYGSSDKELEHVRDTGNRSLLKMSQVRGHSKGLLPQCSDPKFDTKHIETCDALCKNEPRRKCAFAGDSRVNEQPGLSMMHTLWLREHNRIAENLTSINQDWDEERVFQETRRIVIAQWQNIIYKEWLPIAIGQQYMTNHSLYPLKAGQGYTRDYRIEVNPSINVEFAGAAFRFGHSLVPSLMQVMTGRGRAIEEPMRLKSVFFDPSILQREEMMGGILMGQALQAAPAWDPQFSEDLMNHLFEQGDSGNGMDLTALNIQRGRDWGIPGYNRYRELCAIDRYRNVSSFDDLFIDGSLTRDDVGRLKDLYNDVDDIDLFVAGVQEAPYYEALLGPAFACILADQFIRLKIADRFWFENGDDPTTRFTPEQLDSLRKSNMARIICDNTDIDKVQPQPFKTEKESGNKRVYCQNINIHRVDLNLWKS